MTSQFGMDLRCLCVGVIVLVMAYHVTSSGYGRERWQNPAATRPFGYIWPGYRMRVRWPLVDRRSGNTENRSGTYPSEISPLLLDTLCSLCQRLPRRSFPLCVRRYCTF